MKKPILATYCTNKSIPQLTEKDIQQLDIIYISFGRVDGTSVSLSELTCLNRMSEIRKINPSVRLVLTVASGEAGGFSAGTATEEECRLLARALTQSVTENGFDGLDIDWEYPTKEERGHHTRLLRLMREELDAAKSGLTLSIAAGSKEWYFGITELSDSVKYLDYVNIMTYDVNANNTYTMHHTCPHPMKTDREKSGSAEENISVFHKNGVPLEKILIGAAFYSRQWKNVSGENRGLHAFSGKPSDYGPGYTKLIREYENKNGFIRYWDDKAKAPWLFNGSTFITYDDKESLKHKCRLVRETGIAGIMAWEYGYDEEHELIPYMYQCLK